mgnify:CR=1 FL=1
MGPCMVQIGIFRVFLDHSLTHTHTHIYMYKDIPLLLKKGRGGNPIEQHFSDG